MERRLHVPLVVLFITLYIHTTVNATVQAGVSNGQDNKLTKQTLVVLENNKTLSISTFKQLIQDLGQNVDIRFADDTSLMLSKYGEFLYDNIILLCPQIRMFRGKVSVRDLLEFVDAGGNLLLTGSHSPGAIASELASEVGFEFKVTTAKRDYPNTKLSDIYHIVGDKSKYPSASFVYSGAQMKMLRNELSLEILTNNAPVDDIRPSSSSKFVTNVLIGAVQARNNARVLVSGSADFFTDSAFETSKMANKHLTFELLRWLLKEKSILRYSQVQHRKLNADITPSTDIARQTHFEGYTIMDDLEYSIKIEIYEDGKWSPYQANDVQFEFVRIDPFVRQTMEVKSDGTYVARFKVPDVYGVYKMEVDYKKDGLTYLFSSTQVSVRPLRHNEYERFIYSAYPYYLSAFLMMAYLYMFSFVYLYQQKEKRNNK
jgi:oligosaccharyltransferase complex subunit beta